MPVLRYTPSASGRLSKSAQVILKKQLLPDTATRCATQYEKSRLGAAAIHDRSRAPGHAPIVDRNFRADHQAKAEWGREVERLKLIHMPDFDDLIYDFRIMAELKTGSAPDFSAPAAHSRSNAISCSHRRARRRSDHPCRRLQHRPLPDPGGCTRPAQEKSPRSGCYARSSLNTSKKIASVIHSVGDVALVSTAPSRGDLEAPMLSFCARFRPHAAGFAR